LEQRFGYSLDELARRFDRRVTWADFRAILSKRVVFGVDVIEREALQRGRRRFWFSPVRGSPATCNIGPANGWSPGQRPLVQGSTAIILAVYMSSPRRSGEYPDTGKLEALIGMPPSPVLLRLHGYGFRALDGERIRRQIPQALLGSPAPPFHTYRDGTTLSDVADTVIYRGKVADLVVRPDPSDAADTASAAELKRRAGFAGAPPPGARSGR
jgi:hypothetical protein